MPTIAEKINDLDWDNPVERLVALAYIAGQEAATKTICDIHNSRIAKMRQAAKNHRYHRLANSIIDAGGDMIYSPHYAGDVTCELCADEWPNIQIKEVR